MAKKTIVIDKNPKTIKNANVKTQEGLRPDLGNPITRHYVEEVEHETIVACQCDDCDPCDYEAQG